MNWTKIICDVFGGLGLFLLGMKFMSEGMQKVAGERLRKILHFLTSNRFIGVFVGLVVTALVQSSSATTVMVVGFVNAELINVTQAIGVILGANIGTTVTGWIVTLKIVSYALPLIRTGVLIRFAGPSDRWHYIGEVIFGFGMLFLGMNIMSQGFAPLRTNPDFVSLFHQVDGAHYISVLGGVLIGTITTLIIQSSSATTGITIAPDSGSWFLTYQRPASRADLTYSAEASTHPGIASWSGIGVIHERVATGDPEFWRAGIPGFAGERLFLRLKLRRE